MSGLSPVRRLRTKTSDISDFFRGGSAQLQQRQSPSSVDLLQQTLPQQVTEQSASLKSKRSRIPFLGRSKKKSSQLSNDHHSAQELPEPPSVRESATVGQGRDSTVLEIRQPETSAPTSLGSKFAAHFTPTKHRPPRLNIVNKSTVTADDLPNSLVPLATSPRTTSFDSTSRASQDRSPTPRPLRPTITVSVSPPEDLETFNNLFTRAHPTATPSPSTTQPPVQQKPLHTHKIDTLDSSDDDKLEPPELATPNPSPPSSPRMHTSNPTIDTSNGKRISSYYMTDDGSASDFSDHADRHLTMRVLSSKFKLPKKKQISASVLKELERGLGTKIDFDSAEEIEDHIVLEQSSERSPAEDPTPWKRQTVATMPMKSSERPTSPRSCMKPSSASGKHVPGPPSLPLPPPPSMPPPLPPIPPPSSRRSNNSVSNRVTITRPRAHTIPSVVPTSSTATPSLSTKTKGKTQPRPPDGLPSQDGDDPKALKEALKIQRARFDDLAAYLLAVAEKHAVEKVLLMKKIDTLEREARKTGRELKGLRYLVMNGTGSGVFNPPSGLPSGSNSRATTPINFQGSDDGTDRLPSASVESMSSGGKNTKRGYYTPDSLSPTVSRPASLTVPVGDGKFGLGPASDINMLTDFEKRSSASSFSSFIVSASPASSTSSLPLPNLVASSTVSSGLSAIPETRAPSPETRRDPAVAAAILAAERQREKEERRASRALRRLSSSSSASSASAASSAYATNLKRGRPPSIAQVLGSSPSMEDVLEKLRPFATPVKSSNT